MPFFFSATHQHSKRVKTNGQVTALVHDLLMEKKHCLTIFLQSRLGTNHIKSAMVSKQNAKFELNHAHFLKAKPKILTRKSRFIATTRSI